MVFSSAVFLFAFLPIVFILHTAIRNTTVRNILLIVASLLFYAWGEPAYILLLLLSILVNFVLGRFVWGRKPVLAAGVVINLAFLIVFKYAGFIVQSLNAIPFINIREPGISMPIGISFYTFQAMSYVIDTYRDDEKRPGSFFDVMLYICLFPQLVAGPIVKYNSVREQLRDRQVGAEEISAGIRRFIIGLSKKMLIANVMAAAVDKMFALDMAQLDTASAWVGAVCYLFQIYFDFSGYSDMAVGMGKMFGFTFPENFDYPYTASSVRQFWKKWHISLTSWFREYLYFPLGGNRKGKARTLFNRFFVFLCTGIWHGANWTFVVWGIYHGLLTMLETALVKEKKPHSNEAHAERMRIALVNANADMCKKNPDYVVRITGSDEYGKGKLDYFISVASKYPVIATTSKLLSTGVDCKMVKLIVLDQQIGSMTEFKQIIGRGTRIREKEGKTHFVVMDFRNVTRLFADPDWDGPIEIDPDYPPKPCSVCGKNPCVCPKPTPPSVCPVCGKNPCECPTPVPRPKPIVDKNGCEVKVINKVVSVYDTNGKLLRTESITDYTKKNIIDTYATIETFTSKWNALKRKSEIAEMLKEAGIDLAVLKHDRNMDDVDDFDFICHIAYGKKTLTRRERAEQVKKRDVFSKYGEQARLVLEALLDKYMDEGISELENLSVLKNDPFRRFGSPANIARLFGGKQGYLNAVNNLTQLIYNVA